MTSSTHLMTIHNNVGVQKLQEGHVDQAMYAFKRALVVAKQGVATRGINMPPTTASSTPELLSWESLEQSLSLFNKNGPQQQQCQDDDWESFDRQQHQIHAQQAIRLVDPRLHCYCGHGTEADAQIRSGIVIFNLALCFHLQSMYASARNERSSLEGKAQKLYRNALILMSNNDDDDDNVPGPTACLQDVVTLLIVSNAACLSANDSASHHNDLGLLVAHIHRQSYWNSMPSALAHGLESLVEACQWQATFQSVVSVQAAAAA